MIGVIIVSSPFLKGRNQIFENLEKGGTKVGIFREGPKGGKEIFKGGTHDSLLL